MTLLSSNNTITYFVCHGPDAVHYVEVDESSSMTTGQPEVEEFDNEDDAKARAIELGYVFEDDELLKDED